MSQIVDIATFLMEILCYSGYIWAVIKFCKTYLEISRRNERVYIILLFGYCFLVNRVNEYYPAPYILYALICHSLFIVFICLLFQADGGKKIFVASVLAAVTAITGNFCESFFSSLTLLVMHTIKNIPIPSLGEVETGIIICIRFFAEIGVICLLAKHPVSIFYGKTGKWHLILSAPLLFIMAVIEVINWGASNGILVRSGDRGLYYDQIFSHTEICVLTALSMFVVGFYIYGMDKIYLEQEKSSQYHSQIAVYEMLVEQYSQSERLRHDMKNHVIALSGLLENKEWEKMNGYLESMKDAGGFGGSEDVTGNKAIDAILHQKRKLAKTKNINWECDIYVLKTCITNEFDYCVLFGNILDNAIEACEKIDEEERFINIRGKAVENYFLLEVRNSITKMEKDKAEMMEKKNRTGHGIGMLNVRDVVDKYYGMMKTEIEDGVFVIYVLIPLQRAVYDMKQNV